jgi:phosphohistidine swiveling domain-containing protein
MENLDITWESMLMRSYKPFFASLFGIYASKVYDRFMVVYKDDWCYWYLPKEYSEKHDENIYGNVVNRNLKREYDEALDLYRGVIKNIEKINKEYKKIKEDGKLTKQKMLKLLCDDNEFKVFGKGINRESIYNLNTFFNNYGVIVALPEMFLSDYPKKKLAEGIARIKYGKDIKDLKRTVEKLNIDLNIAKLTFNEMEEETQSVEYEKELLQKFKDEVENNLHQLIGIKRHLLDSLSYAGMTKLVGQHSEDILEWESKSGMESEIEYTIRNELSKYPDYTEIERCYQTIAKTLDALIKKYSWMRSGWEFGKGLKEGEIQNRWTEWLFNKKAMGVEIELITLDKQFTFLKKKKLDLIASLQSKGKKKGIDFKKECLPYADIVSFAGLIRYYRKNYASQINYTSSDLIKDIADFCGLKDWEDIYFITVDEIIDILRGKSIIDEREIGRRKKSFLMEFRNSGVDNNKLSGDDKVRSYLDRLWDEQRLDVNPYRIPDIKFPVSGSVVHSWGKKPIEGYVRLIDNEQDLIDTKDNEIVVAKMIEPYQGMLFKNCKGMIIEDKNVASHAVHVAYSKGLPLIVGAENIIWAIKKSHVKWLKMFPDGKINVPESAKEVNEWI